MTDFSFHGIADLYLAQVNPISVVFLVAAFGGIWWRVGRGKSASATRKELARILFSSATVANLPTGAALLICAFDPSLLPKIKEQVIQIGWAGLIVNFEGVMVLREQW
jgi:hypothetical protein